MGIYALTAVGVGAALGAWLRWGFGLMLNSVFPVLPFGTLAANLVGCYLVGIAVEYFFHNTTLPPEVRLFVITGFLGGLTTFPHSPLKPLRCYCVNNIAGLLP